MAQEPAAPEGKLLDPSSFARRQLLSMEMQTIITSEAVLLRGPFEEFPKEEFTQQEHATTLSMNHVYIP